MRRARVHPEVAALGGLPSAALVALMAAPRRPGPRPSGLARIDPVLALPLIAAECVALAWYGLGHGLEHWTRSPPISRVAVGLCRSRRDRSVAGPVSRTPGRLMAAVAAIVVVELSRSSRTARAYGVAATAACCDAAGRRSSSGSSLRSRRGGCGRAARPRDRWWPLGRRRQRASSLSDLCSIRTRASLLSVPATCSSRIVIRRQRARSDSASRVATAVLIVLRLIRLPSAPTARRAARSSSAAAVRRSRRASSGCAARRTRTGTAPTSLRARSTGSSRSSYPSGYFVGLAVGAASPLRRLESRRRAAGGRSRRRFEPASLGHSATHRSRSRTGSATGTAGSMAMGRPVDLPEPGRPSRDAGDGRPVRRSPRSSTILRCSRILTSSDSVRGNRCRSRAGERAAGGGGAGAARRGAVRSRAAGRGRRRGTATDGTGSPRRRAAAPRRPLAPAAARPDPDGRPGRRATMAAAGRAGAGPSRAAGVRARNPSRGPREAGLDAALESLARRSPVPVEISGSAGGRLATNVGARRVLLRLRGTDEHHEAPPRDTRKSDARVQPLDTSNRGDRRRHRRCRRLRRKRAPRPYGPARSSRRDAHGDEQPKYRHDARRGDPVRVVIADDAALVREGVARLLEDAGLEVAGQASEAGESFVSCGARRRLTSPSSTSACHPHTPTKAWLRPEIRARYPRRRS